MKVDFPKLQALFAKYGFSDMLAAPPAETPALLPKELVLKDGSKIQTMGDLCEGCDCQMPDGTPCADGSYELADGTTLAVSGGKVATITPAPNAAIPTEEEMAKVKALCSEMLQAFSEAKETENKELAELKAQFTAQSEEITNLKGLVSGLTEVLKLSEQFAAKPIDNEKGNFGMIPKAEREARIVKSFLKKTN